MFCEKRRIKNIRNILIALSIILSLNLLSLSVKALMFDISEYEYVIDNMRFWSGDLQKDIFETEDFTDIDSVEVDITRRIQGGDDDLLIFAYYSNTKRFISMSKLLINVKFGVESSIKVPIDIADDEILSEIRVFIWEDTDNIIPLSNVLSSKNNSIINPSIENPEYAVIDNFQYMEEYDSYIITVLDEDGRTTRYFYDENKTKIYDTSGKRITNPSKGVELLKKYVYSDYENNVKRDVKDRAVRYDSYEKTREMLKVYFLSPSASTNDGTTYMKEYDAYNTAIGPVLMKDNYTKIFDFCEYLQTGRFRLVSSAWLTHKTKYEAYGYEEKIDGAYPFVIITDIQYEETDEL